MAEFDNIDFSDVFGPVDDTNGGNPDEGAQGITDPANTEQDPPAEGEDGHIDGGKEQDPADPAEDQKQSAEDNAKYAAARRKAEEERDKAIAEMREKHEAALDKVVADMGLTNPYTEKPITTRKEWAEYQKQHEVEEQRMVDQRAKEIGLTDEDRKAMVEADPRYKAAMRENAEAARVKAAAETERITRLREEALAEIRKLDPDVETLEDLLNHKSREKIDELLGRGYTLVDAFEKANKDDIKQREYAAMEQKIRNGMAGKNHLQSSSQHGDGGITVPEDEMAFFRKINKDATDDEIRAFYAKDKARKKK